MINGNLRLAIQKKGRLFEKSSELLKNCNIDMGHYSDKLLMSARNFDLDILLLRDDDIPEYVQDAVADVGIVGEDVLYEKRADVEVVKKLGFGKCKLMIGIKEEETLDSPEQLNGKRIATSYPNILQKYLDENSISAKIVEISGSVEIAPSLGVADVVCDIVSTGTTLKLNKLKPSLTIFKSQAVLIANKSLHKDEKRKDLVEQLLKRMDSALTAKSSKYLMMNLPKSSVETVSKLLPSLKSPTVLPLAAEDAVAVHAVIPADSFWDISDQLKEAGASGILLLPIENMIL